MQMKLDRVTTGYDMVVRTTYAYGAWELSFKKRFRIPFTPFFGMGLTLDKEGENTLYFKANHDTLINYNYKRDLFEVFVREFWSRPVMGDVVDELLNTYKDWERVDTTDLQELKDLMLRDYERQRN